MKPKVKLYILGFLGLVIVGYSLFINSIASDFTYEASPSKNELVNYIIVRIIIGIAYLLSVLIIFKIKDYYRKILTFIFFIGLISRFILLPTEPILEDDFNRYLWDGAVTANGINPFEYAPQLFFDSTNFDESDQILLSNLARDSEGIIGKINHPHIRTIYPPVAQLIFASAYLIKPWSVSVWKTLLLLIDIASFFLVLLILKRIKYSSLLVIIYWWNPILLHEVFNAGHMDILMYPLLLGAILAYLRSRCIISIILICLSVGVKIWPIIFLPFILYKVWINKKQFFESLSVIIILLTIILFPVFLTKFDNSLGFVTYSKNWTNNESVFQLVNILIKQIIQLLEIDFHCSLCVARWVTVIFFGSIILYFLKLYNNGKTNFVSITFLLVAVMFIISPTQFPWYYTWTLPFLVFNPRLSFILYAVFLPLYQLKYSWPFLVWIEHLPVIALFVVELFSIRIKKYLEPF